jgi:hypothetical protein
VIAPAASVSTPTNCPSQRKRPACGPVRPIAVTADSSQRISAGLRNSAPNGGSWRLCCARRQETHRPICGRIADNRTCSFHISEDVFRSSHAGPCPLRGLRFGRQLSQRPFHDVPRLHTFPWEHYLPAFIDEGLLGLLASAGAVIDCVGRRQLGLTGVSIGPTTCRAAGPLPSSFQVR